MVGAADPVEVETVAGRAAVHVLGTGRPTVLWHGLYVDGSSWGYAIPALLPGRTLLVVDAPGWGRSVRLRRSTSQGEVVAAAAGVIEQLAGGPVDWVGEGWGGRVGLALAATRPDLVRSLAAVATELTPMPVDERRRIRRLLAGLRIVGPVSGVGRAIVADRLSPASRTEPQTVGAVLDALLLAGRLHAARGIARFDVRRPDVTELLTRITAPTLLVATDLGPLMPDAAETAAALAPFAHVETIRDARALVALDAPAALTATLQRFWGSLDSPD